MDRGLRAGTSETLINKGLQGSASRAGRALGTRHIVRIIIYRASTAEYKFWRHHALPARPAAGAAGCARSGDGFDIAAHGGNIRRIEHHISAFGIVLNLVSLTGAA